MSGEEIIVIIPRDPAQPVIVEAVGIVGPSCEERTRALEQALGGAVQRELKPEYFEAPAAEQAVIGEA
jgi:hypothetical protein